MSKHTVTGLLDKLMDQYQVFAPVKEGSYSLFKQIRSSEKVDLSGKNTKIPPKGILFPQSEKLFQYSVTKEGAQLEECIDTQQKIIFGLRPCDAKSLLLLDNVFKNDQYEDPYYLTRRENTFLVGIGCNEPLSTCFCTSMGGGPFDSTGLDVLLVDIGDQYVVEAMTEKGKTLIAQWGTTEADTAAKDAAAKVKEQATLSCTVDTTGLKEKLDTGFDNPVWDTIYQKCVGCGSCTYSCPTCHCFDIIDDAVDCNGCRIRNWDSCMYPLFTLHGSGHNPRTSGKERMRQRLMHKFKYFVDNFQAAACVGCGRCIKNCPVNLDIRDMLADILGSEARDQ